MEEASIAMMLRWLREIVRPKVGPQLETSKSQPMWRQGDVLIRRVEAIPDRVPRSPLPHGVLVHGARSTTASLHYSSEYAVGRAGVREILAGYLARPPESFRDAHFGATLTATDRKRAHILRALLEAAGLCRGFYHAAFGVDVLDDVPQLKLL
jgi:hypothetical protein